MDAWVGWLIAAVALGIPLVLTAMPEIGMVAVGALAGAGTAALGGGFTAQVLVFALVSTALVLAVRPLARRARTTTPVHRSGIDALIGRQAVVTARIDGRGGGRVKLAGDVWSARALDSSQVYEIDTQVDIVEIDGATAVVM